MGVTRFRPGDEVVFTKDRGELSPTSKAARKGAIAVVLDPAYSPSRFTPNYELLNVHWISNVAPEHNPISQQDGGYYPEDFELIGSRGFTLKLPTYDDVDTATDLATRIATQFNIVVEVVRS